MHYTQQHVSSIHLSDVRSMLDVVDSLAFAARTRRTSPRFVGIFSLVILCLGVKWNSILWEQPSWRHIYLQEHILFLPSTNTDLETVVDSSGKSNLTGGESSTVDVKNMGADNTPQGQRSRATAAICSIIRDENPYLEEWTLYHLALGFERIYIYDNSDTLNALEWLKKKQVNNTIIQHGVHIHPFKRKDNKRQLKAFRNCIKIYGRNHEWIAFYDPDEFLVLKKHDHVVDMLMHHCRNGSLGINWLIFGTSNRTHYEGVPVTQRFQFHMGVDEHIKTIVKVSDYLGQKSAHWVQLSDPEMRRDTSGQSIKGSRLAGVNNPTFHRNGPIDVAVLHHYKYKSLEEFNAKGCSRGYVWNQQRCFNETLDDLPFGDIWDDTAWQLLQKIVPRYRTTM